MKLAAAQEHIRLVTALTQPRRYRQRSRGARAAGERLSAAALPHAHAQRVVIHDLDKLDVRPRWEHRMVFKRGADAREIQRHGIVYVSNAVRVAGVHGRDDPCFSEHIDRLLEESLPRCRDRDLLRPKLRTAHAHAHSLDRAVGHIQPERLDAGACLDRKLGLVRQAAVMDIFAHAADGVAAHLGA